MPTLQMRKLRLMRVGDLTAVTQLVPCEGVTYCLSFCLPAHRLGTIFLWIFWPSFNSAPTALGDGQHRTALNTYYSLAASTLSTFALSALVGGDGRLDMVWGRVWGEAEGWAGRPGRDLRPCKVDPPEEQVREEAQGTASTLEALGPVQEVRLGPHVR